MTVQPGSSRPHEPVDLATQPGRASGRAARLPLTDVAAVVALVVVGVVMPVVLAAGSHVFSVPSNDDWAYRRDLWEFVRTGHMSFAGWGAMTLVGQVLWGALFAAVFGPQAWVPGAAVAVLATAGIVAAYAVARSVLSRGKALACVLVVLALPGFALNTSSFMTDVPAFSAQVVCLALAVAALGRKGRARWGLLAAALAVGCFGFSVREFDIAAPLAAIATLALQDRRHRLTYGLATIVLAVACGGIYLWAAHVPGAQNIPLALSGPVRFIKGVGNSYFTVSLGLVPLLPAAARRSWARLSARAVLVAVVTVVGGAVLLSSDRTLFNGNYLLQQGATGAAVLTGRPALFPSVAWWALQLVALAAGVLLAAVAASNYRQFLSWQPLCYPRVLLVLFSIFMAIFLCFFDGLTKGTVFDRYLWPLDFSLAVLLLARRPAASAQAHGLHARTHTLVAGLARVAGRAGISEASDFPGTDAGLLTRPRRQPAFLFTTAAFSAVVATVAVVLTLNTDAYDAARWSAGDRAVTAGVPAKMVDAGFEWVGSHQSAVALPGRHVPGSPFYETWYDQMFPTFNECAFVSGNAVSLPWLRRLAMVTYQEVGFADEQDLYVYLVRKPGC